MNNLSRNNHFIAQMYLNAWKDNNNKIHEYRLLVPHEKCFWGCFWGHLPKTSLKVAILISC